MQVSSLNTYRVNTYRIGDYLQRLAQLSVVRYVTVELYFENYMKIGTLTFKHQKHQIMGWLCLRGKLPGVIKHLSPLSKNESKYF